MAVRTARSWAADELGRPSTKATRSQPGPERWPPGRCAMAGRVRRVGLATQSLAPPPWRRTRRSSAASRASCRACRRRRSRRGRQHVGRCDSAALRSACSRCWRRRSGDRARNGPWSRCDAAPGSEPASRPSGRARSGGAVPAAAFHPRRRRTSQCGPQNHAFTLYAASPADGDGGALTPSSQSSTTSDCRFSPRRSRRRVGWSRSTPSRLRGRVSRSHPPARRRCRGSQRRSGR